MKISLLPRGEREGGEAIFHFGSLLPSPPSCHRRLYLVTPKRLLEGGQFCGVTSSLHWFSWEEEKKSGTREQVAKNVVGQPKMRVWRGCCGDCYGAWMKAVATANLHPARLASLPDLPRPEVRLPADFYRTPNRRRSTQPAVGKVQIVRSSAERRVWSGRLHSPKGGKR